MQSLNQLPIEVVVLRDEKISTLEIQNKKNKQFERQQNVSLKEGDIIVIHRYTLSDYPSLFKATNKGVEILSLDYNELNQEHSNKIANIHNEYKIKLEAKDSIIAKANEQIMTLQNTIQKLEEKQFTEDKNEDSQSIDCEQNVEQLEDDVPRRPGRRKNNNQ